MLTKNELSLNKELKKLRLLVMQHANGGKLMGGYIYAHKSVLKRHFEHPNLDGFEFDVCRFPLKIIELDRCEISLFTCKNWSDNEPLIVSQTVLELVDREIVNVIEKTTSRAMIYHHKWQFECPINSDLERRLDAKIRSIATKRVLGRNKRISSQIGSKRFWDEWVNQNREAISKIERELRIQHGIKIHQ